MSLPVPFKNNKYPQRTPDGNNVANFNGRIPPHSAEAEESVLGGILIDNETINSALEILKPEDFYKPANTLIFTAMYRLSDRRDPIDLITLSQELKNLGFLEQVGGIEGLTNLANAVPNSANVSYYARLVKEKSLRRRVIAESNEIIRDAFSEDKDTEDFLDGVEQRILGVSNHRTQASFAKVGDIVQDSIKLIENLYDRKELVTGVPTGFTDLDKMTAGFQPSDLIIIAARPSMGKTALALCIGSYVALEAKKGVAVFSLEMSKEQLVLRMLCAEANVDNARVRTGYLREGDFPHLVNAASKVAEAPMYIDDTPALTITELRSKCRRLHKESPLSMILVDYLQLMRSPLYAGTSREQEISDISRSLKAIAKELHVPVVALSQLNRSVESRTDKRPVMSDLRESGAIEQDADIIMFIYRDEVYNPEDSQEKGIAEIIIGKQRNGPTGVVKLAFDGGTTSFGNLSLRDDVPASITVPSTQFASNQFSSNQFGGMEDGDDMF